MPTGTAMRGSATLPAMPAVATAFPCATEAATRILSCGGNAVDAAVAAAWALSVCEPAGSGLGGQTTLLARFADGGMALLDGHSFAPARASKATISPREQRYGRKAATVPSTVATLFAAQQRWGRLRAYQVLLPAIELAEDGFELSALQRSQIRWCLPRLAQDPAASALLLPGGQAPAPGFVLRQHALGATLRHLAQEGPADFYEGSIAHSIAADMRAHGGLIKRKDLSAAAHPATHCPDVISFGEHRIFSGPTHGGAPQLFAALRLYERFTTAHSLDRPSSLALAIHAAFVQREAHHQPELPLHLDEERLRLVASQWASAPVPGSGVASEEPGDTTHLTVCDRWGNLVSLTQSIQSLFGAKALHPHLGFFYNNYLCTCPRRGHPNRLRPHCRPRSNVTPTLIESPATGRWVALGAAGSRRIVSSLLQVITAILDTGLTLRDAVHAPRLHALLSGSVWVERPLAEASADRLRERFPTLEFVRRHSYAMGCVQAIAVSPHHASEAVADPRRDGSAAVLARMDGCA